MHIRINIPAWGFAELCLAVKILLSLHPEKVLVELQKDIELLAKNWHVYFLSSARYGLMLSIEQLNLMGKHIAVPGYICPAALVGIKAGGAIPVVIDVESDSIRYDSSQLRKAVQDKAIDAILALNTYGLDQDFSFLNTLGIPVIEDSAYKSGMITKKNEVCGLRADIGVWSFNFKALTSVGGGVLFSKDELTVKQNVAKKANHLEVLRFLNYAVRSILKYRIPKLFSGALKPKLSDSLSKRKSLFKMEMAPMSFLQAGIALVQWRSRHEIFRRQYENTMYLKRVIKSCNIVKLLDGQEDEITPHLFPFILCVPQESSSAAVLRFRRFLYDKNIQTEAPYPFLLGDHKKIPNSYKLSSRLLLVPCRASLVEGQIDLIGDAIYQASKVIEKEFGFEKPDKF